MTRRHGGSGRSEWWTEERREQARLLSRQNWRLRHPVKAAVRDEIEASEDPQPCRCGWPEVTLFVTDYATAAHVWVCRSCARAPRPTVDPPEPMTPPSPAPVDEEADLPWLR